VCVDFRLSPSHLQRPRPFNSMCASEPESILGRMAHFITWLNHSATMTKDTLQVWIAIQRGARRGYLPTRISWQSQGQQSKAEQKSEKRFVEPRPSGNAIHFSYK
jgi:hypothetical protein